MTPSSHLLILNLTWISSLLWATLYSSSSITILSQFPANFLLIALQNSAFYLLLPIGLFFGYFLSKLLLSPKQIIYFNLFFIALGSLLGLFSHCLLNIIGSHIIQSIGLGSILYSLYLVNYNYYTNSNAASPPMLSLPSPHLSFSLLMLAPIISMWLSGFLTDAFGFRSFFIIIITILLLSYFYLTKIPLPPLSSSPLSFPPHPPITSPSHYKKFLSPSTSSFLIIIAFLNVYYLIAPWKLITQYQLEPTHYSILQSICLICFILASIISHLLSKTCTPNQIHKSSLILISCGIISLQGILLIKTNSTYFPQIIYWLISSSITFAGLGIYAAASFKPLLQQIFDNPTYFLYLTFSISILTSLFIYIWIFMMHLSSQLIPSFFFLPLLLFILNSYRHPSPKK